jgi:16S rRNA (guanine966-N2)-methyltransferase
VADKSSLIKAKCVRRKVDFVGKRRKIGRRRAESDEATPPEERLLESEASRSPVEERGIAGVRIIGGKHRGRVLKYSGDQRTRPMKDRVREAVFNLVGPDIKQMYAIDLFAGTGALGLEAVSRGAAGVTLIERHLPTTKIIEQNAATIGVQQQTSVVFGDAFRWAKCPTAPLDRPWVVFCSPPYEFYASRRADMLELIGRMIEKAPTGSCLVVEFDEQFDRELLPGGLEWDIRKYLPAFVAIATTGTTHE